MKIHNIQSYNLDGIDCTEDEVSLGDFIDTVETDAVSFVKFVTIKKGNGENKDKVQEYTF